MFGSVRLGVLSCCNVCMGQDFERFHDILSEFGSYILQNYAIVDSLRDNLFFRACVCVCVCVCVFVCVGAFSDSFCLSGQVLSQK